MSGAQASPGRLDGAEAPQAKSGDPLQRRSWRKLGALQRRQSMSPGPGVCELLGLTPCSPGHGIWLRSVFELP